MRRRWFIFGGVLLIFVGLWVLGAKPSELIPSEGGRKLAREFFAAALHPTLNYEDSSRSYERSFPVKILTALANTVRYAVAAMSLALIMGLLGGILGSRAWWSGSSRLLEGFRLIVRLLATAVRSVHELIWALLFLAAAGTSPLAAVLALALPYAGTLVKVFSELFDESSDSASRVLLASGARGSVSFFSGRIAAALPDLVTYSLYRFECCIRSSSILGFVGIPTIGHEIATAYEDGHYREIWTSLYVLLALLLLIEWWGGRARKDLAKGTQSRQAPQVEDSIVTLHRKRARSLFLRGTFLLGISLMVWAWLFESDWTSGVSWERRQANMARFGHELIAHPVQKSGDWSHLPQWLSQQMSERGYEAAWRTFQLGTVSALLAGAAALGLLLFSARSLATGQPRGIPCARTHWRAAFACLLRGGLMLARSLPEYILAFLLLQMFGPTMWSLIFALAIHNAGILARLGGEVIDHFPSRPAELLLSQGGSRSTAYWSTLVPATFNRLVLFLFYRWETCIREATVLGMLGVGSLGFLISESRVRFFYDEMLLFILLGAILVFAGDITSGWVRSRLAKGRN